MMLLSYQKMVKREEFRYKVMHVIDSFFITFAVILGVCFLLLYWPIYLLIRKEGE